MLKTQIHSTAGESLSRDASERTILSVSYTAAEAATQFFTSMLSTSTFTFIGTTMTTLLMDKDPAFNSAFWKWFDSLNKDEKNRFWYLSADMAKIYFYNKFYSKQGHVAQQDRAAVS